MKLYKLVQGWFVWQRSYWDCGFQLKSLDQIIKNYLPDDGTIFYWCSRIVNTHMDGWD